MPDGRAILISLLMISLHGEYNNTVISVAEELDMKVIQWDIDTLDYTRKND